MPTTTTNTYSVSTMRQLVDLNNDMTNFIVDFTAKSTNGEEFECLVVDQKTLDDGTDLQYKKVPGMINGSVSSDKNQYQNYFLILRSHKPCTVEVTLSSQRLSDNLPNPEQRYNNPEFISNNPDDDIIVMDDTRSEGIMSWLKNWKILFAIAIIIFVIYLIKNNKSEVDDSIMSNYDNDDNMSVRSFMNNNQPLYPVNDRPFPRLNIRNENKPLFDLRPKLQPPPIPSTDIVSDPVVNPRTNVLSERLKGLNI